MYLNIQSDPNINLKPQIEEFYLENSLIDFNCTVLGYPIDEQSLIWTFQKCQDFDNCSNNGTNISPDVYTPLIPSDGNIGDGNHYKYESTLLMTIKESGIAMESEPLSLFAMRLTSPKHPLFAGMSNEIGCVGVSRIVILDVSLILFLGNTNGRSMS